MIRALTIVLLGATGVFIVDQSIKSLFLEGFYREGRCIDLVLHFNKGVAFSMFAFLGDWLKWVQAIMIGVIGVFVWREGWLVRFPFAVALLLGGALGNLYDRFVHGAVVDYVAWHCGFDWAVFNFADVAIDIAVVLLFVGYYKELRCG